MKQDEAGYAHERASTHRCTEGRLRRTLPQTLPRSAVSRAGGEADVESESSDARSGAGFPCGFLMFLNWFSDPHGVVVGSTPRSFLTGICLYDAGLSLHFPAHKFTFTGKVLPSGRWQP